MAVTRINNNQISDAITGNTIVGINANTKVQPYSITSNLLANNFTYGSDFTISGNLSVTGTTTAVDTTYTNIQDPLIVLADGQTSGAPALDIGYIGLRGNQSNIAFIWKEANAEFSTTYTTAGLDTSNTTISISSYANLKSNNISAVTDVSSGGNVNAGGNLNVTTDASVGGNLAVSGTGTVTGNVFLGAELSAAGNITATGNIGTAAFLFGDGYYISNINAGNVNTTKIVNGGSYANIPVANGNVTIAVGSTSDVVATFYDQGLIVNIDASVGGNILAGVGISAFGDVTAGGNVVGGNVNSNNNVSAGGNIYATTDVSAGGTIYASTDVSATANVVAGNVSTTGRVWALGVSASGNIRADNWVIGGNISTQGTVYAYSVIGTEITAQGNVHAGYVYAGIDISAGGNITATTGTLKVSYANITNDLNTNNAYANSNVSAGGNITGGNVLATTNVSAGANVYATTNVSAGGNVVGGNVLATTDVSAGGNITGGNIVTGGFVTAVGDVHGGNIFTANAVSAGGNVTGSYVYATNDVSAGGNVIGGNVITNFVISDGSTLQLSATGTNAGIDLLTNGGNIGAGTNWINNVKDPVQAQDAANKEYVDSVASGLQVKTAVVLSTVAPLPAYTYNQPNGAGNGVGATLTATSVGNLFVDGVQVSTLNERVLIQSEIGGNAAYNGIYSVTTVPDDTTAYVLTRTTDFDQDPQAYGAYMLVQQGNTLAGTGQVCTNTAVSSPITFGVTAITFSEFSAPTQYQQGNGIAISGLTISTRVNTGNLEYDGGGNLQVSSSAQFTTPDLGSATGAQVSLTGNVAANNLFFTTQISSTGNIFAGYVSVTGNVDANNVNGNVFATTVSASGNVTGGNVIATTDVTAGGNVIATTNVSAGANVYATTDISAGGNITGGNLATTGSGGNIVGTGWVLAGHISATSEVLAGTDVSAGGNVYGNVGSFANVTATGNIGAGSYLFGDGYYISNINAGNVNSTKIVNGGSYANVTTPNGNVVIAVGSTSDVVATFYDQGVNFNIDVSAGGNVLAGAGISAVGDVTAGGNVVGGNVTATTNVSAGGNVNGNNVNATTDVSAGGNVYGANFATTGSGGNITGANVISATTFTATGNIYADALVNTNLYSANLTSPLGTNGYAIQGGAGNYSQLYVGGTAGAEGINIDSFGGEPVQINTGSAGANTYNWSFSSSDGTFSAPGNIQAGITFLADTVDNTLLLGNVTNLVSESVLTLNSTNSMVVPVGTTGQRPVTPYTGMMRFNTTTNQMEVYNNSEWAGVGGTSYTVITDEQFDGDGSTVTFTLSTAQTTSSCIVSINGVVQIPTLAYAVSGTTLTFTEAPAVGDVIDVRQLTTTTTVTYISNTSGNATVTANYAAAEVDVTGNLVATLSATAPSLTTNSTISFQLVNDTTLAFIVRGTDGTTRTATVTLA